ncbi:type IV secretory system conjugative DNA transfer family protein, partial [Serratia fonticola]
MKKSILTLLFVNGVLCGQAAVAQSPSESAPPDMGSYLSPSQPSSSDVSETRRQLLEEAGRTLGFRGGKAQRAWELRQTLDAVAKNLDALYDFRTLISRQGWLPPVISEAQDVAHITPNQIRTATHVYEILSPERFVSNPPSWRSWLNAGLSTSA